jgi:hypothetical protein
MDKPQRNSNWRQLAIGTHFKWDAGWREWAVAFAAFWVWLTVRLTNRHAPRAKWAVLAIVLVLLVWAASFRY